jgi:hypothetical protein
LPVKPKNVPEYAVVVTLGRRILVQFLIPQTVSVGSLNREICKHVEDALNIYKKKLERKTKCINGYIYNKNSVKVDLTKKLNEFLSPKEEIAKNKEKENLKNPVAIERVRLLRFLQLAIVDPYVVNITQSIHTTPTTLGERRGEVQSFLGKLQLFQWLLASSLEICTSNVFDSPETFGGSSHKYSFTYDRKKHYQPPQKLEKLFKLNIQYTPISQKETFITRSYYQSNLNITNQESNIIEKIKTHLNIHPPTKDFESLVSKQLEDIVNLQILLKNLNNLEGIWLRFPFIFSQRELELMYKRHLGEYLTQGNVLKKDLWMVHDKRIIRNRILMWENILKNNFEKYKKQNAEIDKDKKNVEYPMHIIQEPPQYISENEELKKYAQDDMFPFRINGWRYSKSEEMMYPHRLNALIDEVLVFDTFGDEMVVTNFNKSIKTPPKIQRKIFGKDEYE